MRAIERSYQQGPSQLHILRGVDLAVMPGQSVALIAPSGAEGKVEVKNRWSGERQIITPSNALALLG